MGVKVSKEINLISQIYNVFIEYNNEKLDKLDFTIFFDRSWTHLRRSPCNPILGVAPATQKSSF